MTANPRPPLEVESFLDLLYPSVLDLPDGYLVLSGKMPTQPVLRHEWFRLEDRDALTARINTHALRLDLYISIGVRAATCTPAPGKRGASADVIAIPGLWVELDHAGGHHVEQRLPSRDELVTFLFALPWQWSLLVDSGGGIHAYVLFREPWVLTSPDEHARAAWMLRAFQAVVQQAASLHGWHVDTTADLARILRPAGTWNHKSGTPVPVSLLHEDAMRYDPATLPDAPWWPLESAIPTAPTETTPVHSGRYLLDPVVTQCAWLAHCRDDAATLPEPEWYAMLGIVGRCEEGTELAHTWSEPYPGYRAEETTSKLEHALASAGPRTCTTIRTDLDAERFCQGCAARGTVKSPLVLGLQRLSDPNEGWEHASNATIPDFSAQDASETPPGWQTSQVPSRKPKRNVDVPGLLMSKGKEPVPLAISANVTTILSLHPFWQGKLWWDVIRSLPMIGEERMTDDHLVDMALWFAQDCDMAITNLRMLEQAVWRECRRTPKDLLQHMLHALPLWDQVSRLDTWLPTMAHIPATEYAALVSRILPLQMVARALAPGCIVRDMVILEGEQGVGKSELVRALGGPEWTQVLSMSLDAKEAHMVLQGTWLAEVAELDAFGKTEENRLKSFLTMREDTWIPKYSNSAVTHVRRACFVGTTNSETYLKGVGHTRFLPLKMGQKIAYGTLALFREQLFAEALARYRQGPDTWWERPAHVEAQVDVEREQRREYVVYEDSLRTWLTTTRFTLPVAGQTGGWSTVQTLPAPPESGVTYWQEIAIGFLHLDTPEKWKDIALQRQIAAALRALGWRQAVRMNARTKSTQRIWREAPLAPPLP